MNRPEYPMWPGMFYLPENTNEGEVRGTRLLHSITSPLTLPYGEHFRIRTQLNASTRSIGRNFSDIDLANLVNRAISLDY
jgi:hypothetical protein